MLKHKRNITALIAASLCVLAVPFAHAQTSNSVKTYSAIAVHSLPGQPETFGTIVKSGQNLRLEYEEAGRHVVQILLPTIGAMYVLDPKTRTYTEYLGPAVPATDVEGYTSPCPTQKTNASCQHVGDDVVSGIKVERWALASGQSGKPLVILWNSARRRALRQDFPDGGSMAMSFSAMENIKGRPTEHWLIKLSIPGQDVKTGDWWFDPGLRVVVQENLPSGEMRRLDNITIGPVDPVLFQVPQGWRKTKPATTALQNPVAGNK